MTVGLRRLHFDCLPGKPFSQLEQIAPMGLATEAIKQG